MTLADVTLADMTLADMTLADNRLLTIARYADDTRKGGTDWMSAVRPVPVFTLTVPKDIDESSST